MAFNPLQKSTYLAEIFFQDISPWLQGEHKLLCRRFFQENLGEFSSIIDAFFFEKAYESHRKKYIAPNLSLGQYIGLYERYKVKIKAERLVLWQILSLDIGHGFETEFFIEKNKMLLSSEQRDHLRSYGVTLPSFLKLFEGLSFDALSTEAALAEPRHILFSECLLKKTPFVELQSLVKFSQNKDKNGMQKPGMTKKPL